MCFCGEREREIEEGIEKIAIGFLGLCVIGAQVDRQVWKIL